MKFQSVVMVASFSTWMWTAAAAPETSVDAGLKSEPGKSIAQLVGDLSHEKYRTREDATRKIWAIGEPALRDLQEATVGVDPEQAYRARELIRKIQLHITPETDPAVVQLVERYDKASPEEKVNLFDKLNRKRAWRQILKLYANETNPELQTRLQESLRRRMAGSDGVAGVALIAARECILKGDVNAARDFLEMAPADARGLLALADFHRSQGTLVAELARAKTLKGANGDAWQLALYRASGNLVGARDSANAAGEPLLAAAMAALLGDPLPWLRDNQVGADGGMIHKPYTDLAIRRWQGKPIPASDLEVLVRSANARNRSTERQNGINSLFLLGEPALAEPAYVKSSSLEAFLYFEALERIPDALKALGLDPVNPDYRGWVEKRIENLTKENAEDEHEVAMDSRELLLLANFMEHRGLREHWSEAFLKPLATLAEQDEKIFLDLLGSLFGSNGMMRGGGAPQIAREAAVTWAGDNAARWDEVVTAAFGAEDDAVSTWEWLAELDPKASRLDQLDGMLALCGMGRDPLGRRGKWLTLAWEAIEKAAPERRQPLLDMMVFISDSNPDVVTSLKVWDQLPESSRRDFDNDKHLKDLSAGGRWNEAAEFFLNQLDAMSKTSTDPQPFFYAYAAGCLRKAGRPEEAAAQDALVEKLALGNDAILIASAYAFGCDYQRAADWWARAARQTDPAEMDTFKGALEAHLEMLMEQGTWKEAASVSEVLAQIEVSVDSIGISPLSALKLRLKSDLGRALGNLKEDRAGSIAILEKCQKMFPCDGSLADEFFPALRKMGLIKEHDEWFRDSWERMTAMVERFPGSDNTRNTAAWLASRAMRNLDQAEEFAETALAANPDQSAYLDTMAEIQFAKGNRKKALEWSARAINFTPGGPDGPILRRQHERFRTAPLPR